MKSPIIAIGPLMLEKNEGKGVEEDLLNSVSARFIDVDNGKPEIVKTEGKGRGGGEVINGV